MKKFEKNCEVLEAATIDFLPPPMKKLLEEGEPTKSWKTKKHMRWPSMRMKWDRGREGRNSSAKNLN